MSKPNKSPQQPQDPQQQNQQPPQGQQKAAGFELEFDIPNPLDEALDFLSGRVFDGPAEPAAQGAAPAAPASPAVNEGTAPNGNSGQPAPVTINNIIKSSKPKPGSKPGEGSGGGAKNAPAAKPGETGSGTPAGE